MLLAIEDVASFSKDAETGQRGLLITGDDRCLAPYGVALIRIESRLTDLERLTRGTPDQLSHVEPLKTALESKLRELGQTIEVRRNQGFEAARQIVVSNRGKSAMEILRNTFQAMHTTERSRRSSRILAMNKAYETSITAGILTCLSGILLSGVVGYLVRRTLLI